MQKDTIEEILTNIAHQWRQPLSEINSNVSIIDTILYEKNFYDARLERKLQEIEKLTKYLSKTIDDFRQHLSREKSSQEIPLDTIVLDAVAVVEESLKKEGIALAMSLEKNHLYRYDADELGQILIVLLRNAKDALLNRNRLYAKITLSLYEEDTFYLIEVQDNAGGMPQSVMQKIFEPYYTTKHESQGSGIGLFMAKRVIQERHFGMLSVQNREDGSCFFIRLPKAKNL